MPEVDVSINGRNFRIACDDGQEDHVAQLGEYVDKRVHELVTSLGQVGDSRLLVMASLMMADELSEAYASIERIRKAAGGSEETLAKVIESTADRIESIAAAIDRA